MIFIHIHKLLLNIRLHVYICPCYRAKTVVNFFPLLIGDLGPSGYSCMIVYVDDV